tara:strand:+ start:1260 stop:1799 length:540 start_codon:yes stop_codon:yes gene_type:complete
MFSGFKSFVLGFGVLAVVTLAGCSGIEKEAKYPTGDRSGAGHDDIYAETPSIFGPDGIQFTAGRNTEEEGASGIGVNSYLWKASLDTISFMPLASADPFGGVIITDWYSEGESQNERYKLNVFITDKHLKASALKVSVFRQSRQGGEWIDTAVHPEDARKIEDAILSRARQLRVAELSK